MTTKKNNKYKKTGKGRKERRERKDAKYKKGGTKNKTQKTHMKQNLAAELHLARGAAASWQLQQAG